MAKTPLKTYSLAEIEDKYIGKMGTASRDKYEHKLKKKVSERKEAKSKPKSNDRLTTKD
jgi:hypothetical protein